MKAIKLNKSPKLIKTPDFTDFPVLEELELKDCINLLALHPSIGVHKKLILLNLKGCENLKSLPRMLEMESLEILILSECSKVKSIPKFGENMKSASEFYLDGTAITKLPTSIGNLTGLVLLNVKDCKNLMTLPSTFSNLNSLEKLHLSGCSKLLKILGATESLEGLDEIGTVKKLKNLFIDGVKRRSINPFDLSITSLSSSCFLSKLETLDLSYCNLNAIPNAFCCLSTLKNLNLRGNNFGSFRQGSPNPLEMLLTSLSEGLFSLKDLDLSYCNLNVFSDKIGCLHSLERLILTGNKFGYLPESIVQLSNLSALTLEDCPSLHSLPMLPFRTNFQTELIQRFINKKVPVPFLRFFGDATSIDFSQKEWPQPGLHQDFLADIERTPELQEHKLIFGSEIPEWFEHQNIGAEISIEIPTRCCNQLWGIVSCGVISYRQPVDLLQLDCYFIRNGKIIQSHFISGQNLRHLSKHLFLAYFPDRVSYAVNGLDVLASTKFGIRYRAHGSGVEVDECGIHTCGLRIFYNRFPYESSDDSDFEESSEYHECGEELPDWEESSESDQEG